MSEILPIGLPFHADVISHTVKRSPFFDVFFLCIKSSNPPDTPCTVFLICFGVHRKLRVHFFCQLFFQFHNAKVLHFLRITNIIFHISCLHTICKIQKTIPLYVFCFKHSFPKRCICQIVHGKRFTTAIGLNDGDSLFVFRFCDSGF